MTTPTATVKPMSKQMIAATVITTKKSSKLVSLEHDLFTQLKEWRVYHSDLEGVLSEVYLYTKSKMNALYDRLESFAVIDVKDVPKSTMNALYVASAYDKADREKVIELLAQIELDKWKVYEAQTIYVDG